MNSKGNKKLLKLVNMIARHEVKLEWWGPRCVGFLHQPKRPRKPQLK